MKNIITKVIKIILFLFNGIILVGSIRGKYGSPNSNDLLRLSWRDNGPFELSPERGRFALLYSIVEDNSFYFSTNIARFILPDLGYKDGHYVSLFAPAVSFIAMPGYLIGKSFGVSQFGAYITIILFAIANIYLIKQITKKLGGNDVSSLIVGIMFVFATPAYAYTANLYQHHISAFLILSAFYLLINWSNFWSLAGIWFLCTMSIPVDYPNLFLMFPIGISALAQLISTKKIFNKVKLSLKFVRVLSFVSIIIPLGFFLWFNNMSYGNPLQFSGTVTSVSGIDANGNPISRDIKNPEKVEEFINAQTVKKSAFNWFESRRLLNGFYIHILSPDRGIITFTPVILLGIIGAFVLYKEKNKHLAVLLGIIGANLLLYSMWGDPWGGWAFGSRYMIPSYAILAILLGVALTKFGKKWWFIVPFWLLLIYSIGVNTLGALTTSANPPQAESLALEKISGKRERYSYDRNWEFLNTGGSKSFVYQTWGNKYISAVQYYYIIAGSIALISTILTVALVLDKKNGQK